MVVWRWCREMGILTRFLHFLVMGHPSGEGQESRLHYRHHLAREQQTKGDLPRNRHSRFGGNGGIESSKWICIHDHHQ